MIKRALEIIFILSLISTSVHSQTKQKIEVFDINKGEVSMNAESNTDTRRQVIKILEGIKGVYVKNNPIPNKGFMIRIPLEPNVMLRNNWFHDLVDEVIIILSDRENPYLMVFDDENKTYFFTFEGDISELFKLINFQP